MGKKSKKLKRAILEGLKEKVPLSTNRGILLSGKYPKPNSKVRRHSGRVYPKVFGTQKALDEDGILVDYVYNDWQNYRDGYRAGDRDKLRKANKKYWIDDEEVKIINEKQKKLLKRREARKIKMKQKVYK
jgi:hypothetical protein